MVMVVIVVIVVMVVMVVLVVMVVIITITHHQQLSVFICSRFGFFSLEYAQRYRSVGNAWRWFGQLWKQAYRGQHGLTNDSHY